jgi:hypothetical protein
LAFRAAFIALVDAEIDGVRTNWRALRKRRSPRRSKERSHIALHKWLMAFNFGLFKKGMKGVYQHCG